MAQEFLKLHKGDVPAHCPAALGLAASGQAVLFRGQPGGMAGYSAGGPGRARGPKTRKK